MELTDHYRKALEDQIEILWRHRCECSEMNLGFIRDHATAIMQLTDEILFAEKSALSGTDVRYS